jgi:hypothetical protein
VSVGGNVILEGLLIDRFFAVRREGIAVAHPAEISSYQINYEVLGDGTSRLLVISFEFKPSGKVTKLRVSR